MLTSRLIMLYATPQTVIARLQEEASSSAVSAAQSSESRLQDLLALRLRDERAHAAALADRDAFAARLQSQLADAKAAAEAATDAAATARSGAAAEAARAAKLERDLTAAEARAAAGERAAAAAVAAAEAASGDAVAAARAAGLAEGRRAAALAAEAAAAEAAEEAAAAARRAVDAERTRAERDKEAELGALHERVRGIVGRKDLAIEKLKETVAALEQRIREQEGALAAAVGE